MPITSADIKSFLEIDSIDDSVVVGVLNGVIAFVEQYTGKKMTVDAVDVTEYYHWDGTQILFLKRYPVVSITSLSYNTGTLSTPVWTAFSGDDYYADLQKWEIIFPSRSIPRGFWNIKVVGKFWYATLPANLELAIKLLCGKVLNRKDSQGIDSESVQWTSLSYSKDEMSDEIKQLLDPYKSYHV